MLMWFENLQESWSVTNACTYCALHDTRGRYSYYNLFSSVQLVQSLSRVLLCDPMNRSKPGLPVHHQLPELAQTHVHHVSDAIQPSHPLSSHSPPAPIPSSIRVFSNESTLHMRWPSTGVSASASFLSKNTQDRSPLEWTGWISW